MADTAWRQGRPAETDTGLLQALLAFLTQGGQLFGAYRWPDNPLTLTHVRWQARGSSITQDAFRQPEAENAISSEERDVWVQIALHMPIVQGGPAGSDAPWLPVAVAQDDVSRWVNLLRQGQLRHQTRPPFQSSFPSAPQMHPGDGFRPPMRDPLWQGGSGGPLSAPPSTDSFGAFSGGYAMPREAMPSPSHDSRRSSSAPPPTSSIPPFSQSPSSAGPYSTPSTTFGESDQWTGPVGRGAQSGQEATALVSVEVELPTLLTGTAAEDYRRDFAQDVALHFGRAVRSIPQVREARGWMRGERLILAARFVFPGGPHTMTRAEMEGAAQALADALAQRTLPYSRLTFADPGEWMQGAPLPE